MDGVGGYTCQCVLGYTGTQCQTDIDNCAGVNCSASGAHRVCKDGLNSYTCACKDGYTGKKMLSFVSHTIVDAKL